MIMMKLLLLGLEKIVSLDTSVGRYVSKIVDLVLSLSRKLFPNADILKWSNAVMTLTISFAKKSAQKSESVVIHANCKYHVA